MYLPLPSSINNTLLCIVFANLLLHILWLADWHLWVNFQPIMHRKKQMRFVPWPYHGEQVSKNPSIYQVFQIYLQCHQSFMKKQAGRRLRKMSGIHVQRIGKHIESFTLHVQVYQIRWFRVTILYHVWVMF